MHVDVWNTLKASFSQIKNTKPFHYCIRKKSKFVTKLCRFFMKIKFSRCFFAFFRFLTIIKYIYLYIVHTQNMKRKTPLKKLKTIMKNHDKNLYILFECIGIIMIWRWVWELLDIYIIPNNPLVSNIICIIIWIIILLLDDWRLWELEEEPHRNKNR